MAALEVPDLSSGNPTLQRAMQKLVQAEQKPLDRIDEKIAKSDNQLKLVKDLKGKINEIRDAVKPFGSVAEFRELVGISSDPTIVQTTTIDKTLAKPGSYDIEVLSLSQKNSIMTKGFPDRDKSQVGVGYVSFNTPDGQSHDVYINSDNNTLDGVAKAINEAKMGVTAVVVNDGTDADHPWRLIMSGDKGGWKNDYEWPEFNFLDGDFDLDIDRQRKAQSAVIRLNGQPVMVDDNSVKSLIPGVNFDLRKAAPGQTIKLEIKDDIEKIEGKAKSLVDKLNAALSFIQNQNALTKDSFKDPTKALGGDVVIQGLESRLHGLILKAQDEMDGSQISRLQDLGIVFNRQGTLDYDPKKFQSQLENHFDEVVHFLSGDSPLNGFAHEVVALADSAVRSGDGMLAVREKNLSDNRTHLEDQKKSVQERAEKKIERAKLQFGKAEEAIAKLQSVSGITQGIGGGGGSGVPGMG